MTTHDYRAELEWTGSTGVGHRSYSREHTASVTSGTALKLSADAAFLGDAALPNPEQLLVVAASSCQLLSFLGAASREGLDVVAYEDDAIGRMPAGTVPMSITHIELRPVITVRDADPERVKELVVQAHETCYIANSLRSEVRVNPIVEVIG